MKPAEFRIETADPARGVERAVAELRGYVRRAARRIAAEREELIEDLVQEGMIGVWVADPSRLDLDDPRDRLYARRTIRRRIRAAWAREIRATRPPDVRLLSHRVRGDHYYIGSSTVGLNGVVRRRQGAE
jgi:DNA-directed RNA polymerase specialized sigma24 family protein